MTRSCLDQDVCRLLQLGFGRFKHGCGFQVDVHADEISVHLWGVSHRRRRGLLCRGHRSYYDGQARQKKRSGTEPPFVSPPKHSVGNLVVSMLSRLTELDLNTPGPIRDTYLDTMQLAPVRLPNLATTPTISGLATIPQFPVLPTLLVHPVNIEYQQTVCPTSPSTSWLTWSFNG